MKKIILFLIIFIIQFSNLVSKEPKLEEILSGLRDLGAYRLLTRAKY